MGEAFGETDLIVDRPRNETARAVDTVTVRAVERARFLRALDDNIDIANPVLNRLFRTLHQPPEFNLQPAPLLDMRIGPAIQLLPSSDQLRGQIDAAGVAVSEYPFRVGRRPARGESLPPGGLELMLMDAKPFNLSRRHFSIEANARQPTVRDAASHLGTMVNGTRIGGLLPKSSAPLETGENEVIAGKTTSPCVFRVVVEPE